MPIIETQELRQGQAHPSSDLIYNGLDCCLTHEVFGKLSRLYNREPVIYDFERALQAPALDMMERGFRVDEYERRIGTKRLEAEIVRLDGYLQQMASAVWGKTLNPRSSKQLQEFLYGAMKLPEQWISQKGVKKLSTNREVLEKLSEYFHARPIIATILAIRERKKQLEVLTTEIRNGRLHFSINVAGTETGRFSSSASAFGDGRNIQNIEDELRKIFISDEGMKLCQVDQEQSESRECGFLQGVLFNDWTYLDACESGDLHTIVCKLIWPDLGWTGDLSADKDIAEQIFYRHFSYRDMAKRGGHGSNYYGKPFTMARHLKVPTSLIETFQERYFDQFPAFPDWHRWTAQQLQTTQFIETPFGRRRHFFGRPDDDSTLREAIAFVPQSMTADRTNLGLWRIWAQMNPQVQLLVQGHDAVIFQYPESADEHEIISTAMKLMEIELTHQGRSFIVPGEAKVGWNWGKFDAETNPNGMVKYKGPGSDKRERVKIMDRKL